MCLSFQALIELLDQVEDVISVEESVCDGLEAHSEIEKSNESASALRIQVTNSKSMDKDKVSNLHFLVLEVHTCEHLFTIQLF